jgi:hypothetical protein
MPFLLLAAGLAHRLMGFVVVFLFFRSAGRRGAKGFVADQLFAKDCVSSTWIRSPQRASE